MAAAPKATAEETPTEEPTTPAAPAKDAPTAEEQQHDDIVEIVNRLSPDKLMALKVSLGIRSAENVPPPPAPPPLHVQAAFQPVDVEATKEMKASDVASKLDVELDDLLGFSIRTPLNLDGQPMGDKGVLTGVLVSGEKVAVEYSY